MPPRPLVKKYAPKVKEDENSSSSFEEEEVIVITPKPQSAVKVNPPKETPPPEARMVKPPVKGITTPKKTVESDSEEEKIIVITPKPHQTVKKPVKHSPKKEEKPIKPKKEEEKPIKPKKEEEKPIKPKKEEEKKPIPKMKSVEKPRKPKELSSSEEEKPINITPKPIIHPKNITIPKSKPDVTKVTPTQRSDIEIDSEEEEEKEEIVDPWKDPILDLQIEAAEALPSIDDSKYANEDKLATNDPFVLHFLLDGFLSDDLGNISTKTNIAFSELLSKGIKEKWALQAATELLAGSKIIASIVPKKLTNDIKIDELIHKEAKDSTVIPEDIILTGGYRKYSGNGHTLAFRVNKQKQQIIFTNTGEGVTTHPEYKGFRQLYYVCIIPDEDIFTSMYRLLVAGITSPYIGNIFRAYEHQVSIVLNFKQDKALHFKDNRTIPESEGIDETWITHKNNWVIDSEGKLYARQQLTGTCTFHSIFWQLLLDVWLREGSMGASRFEKQCRDFVLEEMVNLGPPLVNKQKSRSLGEQISCLQLLVRKYRSFKGRDQALRTLQLIPQNILQLTTPSYSTKLDVEEFPKDKNKLNKIAKRMEYVIQAKNLQNAVFHLTIMGGILLEQSLNLSENPNEAHKAEGKYFIWWAMQLMASGIKHAYPLPASVDNVESLAQCVNLFIIFRSLPRNYNKETTTVNPIPTLTLIVGMMAKLHNSLPEKMQLRPHEEEESSVEIFGLGIPDCVTANFIRQYANYGYTKDIQIDSSVAQEWQKYTLPEEQRPQNIILGVDTIETGAIPSTFIEFMKSSQANASIGTLFSFIRIPLHVKYIDYYPGIVYLIEAYDNPKFTNYNRTGISEPLSMIADLDCGQPLSRLAINDYFLPKSEILVRYCTDNQIAVYNDNGAMADPESYYSLREAWMKDVWIKIAPQLSDNLKSEIMLPLIALWLMYLWPEGPPNEIKAQLPDVIINTKESAIATLLTFWVSRGTQGSLDKIIKDAIDKYLDFESSLNGYGATPYLRVLQVFIRSLFFLPQLAVDLFIQLLGQQQSKPPRFVLDIAGAKNLPYKLRNLFWTADDVSKEGTITYSEEKRQLVILSDLLASSTVMRFYQNEANVNSITHASWKKADGSVEVWLYFGDQIVILTSTTLITPLGEEYMLVPLQEVPPLMRQWCQDYTGALAIPLKQIQDGKTVYFFFLAGIEIFYPHKSVFDLKYGVGPIIFNTEKEWHIYTMQSCGVAPVLNYINLSWRFLLVQVIKSVKVNCIVHINSIISSNWAFRFPQGEILNKTHSILGFDKATPLVYKKDIPRKEYMKFLEQKYDEPISNKGTPEERIASIKCSQVNLFPYIQHIPLLLRIVYTRFGHPEEYVLKSRTKTQALFEVMSGLLVYPNQVVLYERIKHDLMTRTARVRIALMGIGKSKVILPMLAICAQMNMKFTHIVQPEHLVPQTYAIFDEIVMPVFGRLMGVILSDTQAKEMQLAYKVVTARIVIFDEIDAMYNPYRSEYNIPRKKVLHPLNIPLIDYYKYVVAKCYNIDVVPSGELPQKFLSKFDINLNEAKTMRHIFHYGLSKDPHNLLAVPYSAVETPVEGAVFSDIDLTAILSCFIRLKNGLSVRDFVFLRQRLYHWHNLVDLDVVANIPVMELLTMNMDTMMKKYKKNLKLQMFYLTNILLPEKLHSYKKQLNVSFIDLMAPVFSTQRVGFSGTDLIILPQFAHDGWKNIVPDTKGVKAIRDAIIGWEGNVGIYPYSKDKLWSVLCDVKLNFTVLIDADALLRKKGKALDVVTKWAKEDAKRGQTEYIYIFLDDEHIAYEYTPKAIVYPLFTYRSNGKYKWYYDQRHTIGIDLKIHTQAKALTLASNKSRLTDIAQAVFRLRKLGPDPKTSVLRQSTHFMIEGKLKHPNSRTELYNLFVSNNENYKTSMLPRHNLQNIKAVYREEQRYSEESYEEEVRYYPQEIKVPLLTSPFGIKLAESIGEITLNVGEDADVQQIQEHEQEEEKAKERIIPGRDTTKCYDVAYGVVISLKDYEIGKGIVEEKELNISLSNLAVDETIKKGPKTLCYIRYDNGKCLIITASEYMLLKARNFSLLDRIYFRYCPYSPQADWITYLAAGICGRHVLLHEQLEIIKHISTKEARREFVRVMKCFKALEYEFIEDFLFQNVPNKIYLQTIASMSYENFIEKWVKWNVDTPKIRAYYKKCMDIAKV